MRTIQDFQAWARTRYAHRRRGWLADPRLGEAESVSFGLQPPSEADVAADPDRVHRWVADWSAFERAAPEGVCLDWVTRNWRSFGRQRLPARVALTGAGRCAWAAGTGQEWGRIAEHARRLRFTWGAEGELSGALSGSVGWLASASTEDVVRLVRVVDWLVANPGSALLPRQLPVHGVDTKWFERNRPLVETMVGALTGDRDLGLSSLEQQFQLRLLDPDLLPGMLRDLSAPATELDRLSLRPSAVLILENRTTLAALPDIPGVAAVHGWGYAVSELAGVGWVTRSPVLYWGDLDSHGFAILSRARAALPQAESVLMDPMTLELFRALAVSEPHPVRGEIANLTPDEARALSAIREGGLRLEQERIDMAFAVAAIASRAERARS